MSLDEIIQELPKLTPKERAALQRRLQDFDEPDDLLFLQEAADLMFKDMDQQEALDARR